MDIFLGIFDNALLQGLSYGVAVLGIAIAFRVLKYPDLTADGSFLLGACTFGVSIQRGLGWPVALLGAILAGALAGLFTAFLQAQIRINRLLTGILTSMICYSLAFHVLSGRPNISMLDASTMFSWAARFDGQWGSSGHYLHPMTVAIAGAIATFLAILLVVLLRSELGIILRATGENQALVEEMGRRPSRYCAFGLALANGLVGLSGALVAGRQGFVDVNMAVGIIIALVASLVIGEDLLRLAGTKLSSGLPGKVLAPLAGSFAYYALFLLILRASIEEWIPLRIQPTDLKLLSALVVIIVIGLRARASRKASADDVLPI